jgi:exportin-2 (importin alpha re-exporter)
MKAVIMTLLTRMQTSKTDMFVYSFTRFLLFTMAINVEGLTPNFVIGTIEEIQPQCVLSTHYSVKTESIHHVLSRLWSQILGNFVIPQVPKMSHKDRKIAVVGVTRMLTQSTFMLQEPSIRAWYVIANFCNSTVPVK